MAHHDENYTASHQAIKNFMDNKREMKMNDNSDREICKQLKSMKQDIQNVSSELKILEDRLAPTIPVLSQGSENPVDDGPAEDESVEPCSEMTAQLYSMGHALRSIRRRIADLHEQIEI